MTYWTSLLCLIVAFSERNSSRLNRPGSQITGEMAVTLSLRKRSLVSVVLLLFCYFINILSVWGGEWRASIDNHDQPIDAFTIEVWWILIRCIIFKVITGNSSHTLWWEGKCRKNHGAGRFLGKFSLLGNVRHLSYRSKSDTFQGYQTYHGNFGPTKVLVQGTKIFRTKIPVTDQHQTSP